MSLPPLLHSSRNNYLRGENGQEDKFHWSMVQYTPRVNDVIMDCMPYANQKVHCTAAQCTSDTVWCSITRGLRKTRSRRIGVNGVDGLGKMNKVEQQETWDHGGMEVGRKCEAWVRLLNHQVCSISGYCLQASSQSYEAEPVLWVFRRA